MAKISNIPLPSTATGVRAALPATPKQAQPASRSGHGAASRLSGRVISVGGSVPSLVESPRSRDPYPALDSLIGESGVPVPDHLLEHHAEAMAALLGQGPTPPALPVLVNHAADALQQVHRAFVTALPDGPAAASVVCQEVASVLMGEARLINHIHHTGVVPGQPDHFLALASELPPSLLDHRIARSLRSTPAAGRES